MRVILSNVVLRFADLYVAKVPKNSANPTDRPRYTASFLIEPGSENDTRLNDAITAVAVEKWAGNAKAKLKSFQGQKTQYCYREPEGTDERSEGMLFLSSARASTQGAPRVVNRQKQDVLTDVGLVYPGCTVNAIVDIWAQSEGNSGIRCALQVVQFIKDGEAFSGDTLTTEGLPSLSEGLDEEDDLV